jgi:hypothetical protein
MVEAVEVVALASVDLVEAASVEAVPAEAGKKKGSISVCCLANGPTF